MRQQELFPSKTTAVFVFGSNLAGRHGKGAAYVAMTQYGATYGKGLGRYGNSYAIPTKTVNFKSLPLNRISEYVSEFIEYAKNHKDEKFYVTRIGCGLAGYTDADIAPMFANCPDNCYLPKGWRKNDVILI